MFRAKYYSIFSFIFILISATACLDRESFCPTELIMNEQMTRLNLGMDLSESLLDSILIELKSQRNIDLDISDTQFDENGNLKLLKIDVDCNDGVKGEINANRDGLYSSCVGFIRNYSPESSFRIGILEQ